ncbi:MAG TPA: calcium/sodium antiporter [Treponemataceae bacterium]|nr:calcium/sodium antiporter [Treponemataceae bacterium]
MLETIMLRFISLIPHGGLGLFILLAIIAGSLVVLSKGADILVDEAVLLSVRWGVPKMIIGATIVSLGTTLPEVTVSVMSALKGAPGLAMGNAVGSIICDTGLILGIAALIRPLPFKKEEINTQSWIQLGSAVLLVTISFVFGHGLKAFNDGGRVPQSMGWFLLLLLGIYLIRTIHHAQTKKESSTDLNEGFCCQSDGKAENQPIILIILKLIIGVGLVIVSSKVLIPSVQETAVRFHIPENIIAATLVAFGTSLPELTTAITATRKGHGDLAIGNVMGADVLNVLFVVGAAAAVTPQGLEVQVSFFRLLFPAMLFILCVFKGSVLFSKDTLKRPVGFVLVSAYVFVTVLSYLTGA